MFNEIDTRGGEGPLDPPRLGVNGKAQSPMGPIRPGIARIGRGGYGCTPYPRTPHGADNADWPALKKTASLHLNTSQLKTRASPTPPSAISSDRPSRRAPTRTTEAARRSACTAWNVWRLPKGRRRGRHAPMLRAGARRARRAPWRRSARSFVPTWGRWKSWCHCWTRLT